MIHTGIPTLVGLAALGAAIFAHLAARSRPYDWEVDGL